MASSSAPLARSDDRLLLAQEGASTLPSPIALQLLDIPFVLPLQQQPARTNGTLPDAAWRLEYELSGTDRTRYVVRVTGDPSLGLPYGRDADVLLALFRILDDGRDTHDLATGTLRSPNYHMICRALGMEPTGPLVRRIRDALRRLANVRIESRMLVDRTAEATHVLAQDGSALPSPAGGRIARRHEVEESRWLLEYRTESRTVETQAPALRESVVVDDDAPDASEPARARVERTFWIHELRVNPFWVSQAISGWAGWIDVERHASLQSITARRLYQLCAAQAARHLPLPWVFRERELYAACMLTTEGRKPTRLRQLLTDAAAELTEAGVLASHAWHGTPRRGAMEFVLDPGPLLRLGGLLRGIGLTDPPDARVQYALLRGFGVAAPRARALIAEKPGQVGEVLLRACHLRASDPGAVTKSWAGWIIHHIEQDTSFVGEVAFQQWRRVALARLDAPFAAQPSAPAARPLGAGVSTGVSAGERPSASTRGRAVAPGPVDPAAGGGSAWDDVDGGRPVEDADAGAQWARVRAAIDGGLSALDQYWVREVVAVGSATDELVLCVPNALTEQALHRLLPRITASLADVPDGGATVETTVRIALVQRATAARGRGRRGPTTAP